MHCSHRTVTIDCIYYNYNIDPRDDVSYIKVRKPRDRLCRVLRNLVKKGSKSIIKRVNMEFVL